MFFHTLNKKIFADFLSIYAVLPKTLQRATLRVFALVFLQAVLEVIGILSISVLAISIAAPERLFSLPPVEKIFVFFPQLFVFKEDPRIFTMTIASLVAVAMAAKNGATALVTYATTKLGERIALFAGQTIFSSFLYSTYLQFLVGDSPTMFQALSWRIQLGQMVAHLLYVYTYSTVVFALAITLVCVTPFVIILVMVALGVLAIAVYKALRGRLDQASRAVTGWQKEETQVTLNAMQGLREVLIYRQQDVFFERFQHACLGGVPHRAFIGLAPPIPTWVLETAGFIIIVVTLAIMFFVLDASMAKITAVLSMIMLISWRILPLLNRSLGALVAVRSSRHAALECLERIVRIQNFPVPVFPDPEPGFAVRSQIAFINASFRYPKAETDSLFNLNFSIPCGSRVGIIGQSGAGKSSIANILSGLVPPTTGQMLVDGKELTPSELVAYRQRVGYVPQNPYILAGSLAENVAFSQWGKPWDEEKVLKACAMAELDVVRERGIEFSLGQGGTGLSGGQAQRLSIARALYADPSILILDEATSALDTGLEAAIMNTIFALPQNITTVVIAHRLSTVERCDNLVWIEKGSVRMVGTPETVLLEYNKFLEQQGNLPIFRSDQK